MDKFLLLELIALVLTGFLVYHSLRFRGKTFTLMFFLAGALLGILRENLVSRFTQLYSYNPETFHLWAGSAPLILAVFWSYTIYISLSLSEAILNGSLTAGRRRASIILLSMAFMAAYACFNEAFASMFSMVLWKFKPAIALWGETPIMVLWGYAGMALIFLLFLLFFLSARLSNWLRVVLMCISTLLMIPLHLVWIAIFQKILALLIS